MFTKNKNYLIVSCLIAALSLTGCAGNTGSSSSAPADETAAAESAAAEVPSETAVSEPLSIVCTIFPEYDWVKEILGGHAANAELTYLLDNDVDLHSYQPTADDIMKISNCDLFIYVGGESDEWVEDALAEATNKDGH